MGGHHISEARMVTYHFYCFFFFETMLSGEHSGKVSRKFISNFFSEENFSELKFLFIIMHANQAWKGTSYSNMHASDSSQRIRY